MTNCTYLLIKLQTGRGKIFDHKHLCLKRFVILETFSCKSQVKAMTSKSNPCQSAFRSVHCPPISDSESDDEAACVTDLSGGSLVHAKPVDELECLFIERSAPDGTRIESIEKLKVNADQLQTQIEVFELEKKRVQDEIRQKKRLLIEAIFKVIEFEKSIQAFEDVIADKLCHFQTRLIGLEAKRMEINLHSGDAKVLELLEREIGEVKEEFEQAAKVDGSESDQLAQQAQQFAATLGDVTKEFQNYLDEMISEAGKEDVDMIQIKFNDDMAQLTRLLNRPAQFCCDKSGNRFYINASKEKVFKIDFHSSEYKLTDDGVRDKIKAGFKLDQDENGEFYVDSRDRKIYTKYYFEDDFGPFYIDVHGHRHYKADPEASEYMLINENWKKTKEGTGRDLRDR